MRLRKILGLLAIVSLGRCGPPNPQGFEPYDRSLYLPDQSQVGTRPLQFRGQAVHFRCLSSECTEGQALILSQPAGSSTLSNCSASLVADDLVLTNAHCLADREQRSPSDIEVFFPNVIDDRGDTVFEAAKRWVASVVAISKQTASGRDQDFVVLKLSRPIENRAKARMNPNGVVDGAILHFSSSLPSLHEGEIFVRAVKQSCRTVMNSLVQLGYDHPLAPVIAISGCSPVFGDSGSGLFNAQGELSALVQAGYLPGEPPTSRIFRKFTDDAPVPLVLPATNLACVSPFRESHPSISRYCEKRLVSDAAAGLDLIKRLSAQLESRMDTKDDTSLFLWRWTLQFHADPKELWFTRTPVCIKATMHWANDALVKYKGLPSYRAQFNGLLQFRLSERPDDTGLDLRFTSPETSPSVGGKVTLIYTSKTDFKVPNTFTAELPRCTPLEESASQPKRE